MIDSNILALTLKNNLSEGYRLKDPKYCPDKICDLMQSCWNAIPEKRPTFSEIKDAFANIYKLNDTVRKDSIVYETLFSSSDSSRQSIISDFQSEYVKLLKDRQELQKKFSEISRYEHLLFWSLSTFWQILFFSFFNMRIIISISLFL